MAFIPEWLQGVIDTMQKRANEKYEDDLNLYRQASQDWITTNVINRDNGLPITPFTRPVPARVVFGTDENGTLSQTSSPDPSIKAPELPPAAPKQPSTPFRTTAPYADAAEQAVMGQILQFVAETNAAVARIASKVGA